MDTSKTNPIVQEETMQNVPLMLVRMEIVSIGDFKIQEASQNIREGEVDQEGNFYDALEKLLFSMRRSK